MSNDESKGCCLSSGCCCLSAIRKQIVSLLTLIVLVAGAIYLWKYGLPGMSVPSGPELKPAPALLTLPENLDDRRHPRNVSVAQPPIVPEGMDHLWEAISSKEGYVTSPPIEKPSEYAEHLKTATPLPMDDVTTAKMEEEEVTVTAA
jgi:hypothetical protein